MILFFWVDDILILRHPVDVERVKEDLKNHPNALVMVH